MTFAQLERTYTDRECSDGQALYNDLMDVLRKANRSLGQQEFDLGQWHWELHAVDAMELRSHRDDSGRELLREGDHLSGIPVVLFFTRSVRGSQLVRNHGNLTTVYQGPDLVLAKVSDDCEM